MKVIKVTPFINKRNKQITFCLPKEKISKSKIDDIIKKREMKFLLQ